MNEPRAWECRRCGRPNRWNEVLCVGCLYLPRKAGTPLVAAPPARTVAEAAATVERFRVLAVMEELNRDDAREFDALEAQLVSAVSGAALPEGADR